MLHVVQTIKVIIAHLLKKFSTLVTVLTKPTLGFYPEPDESSTYFLTLFP